MISFSGSFQEVFLKLSTAAAELCDCKDLEKSQSLPHHRIRLRVEILSINARMTQRLPEEQLKLQENIISYFSRAVCKLRDANFKKS